MIFFQKQLLTCLLAEHHRYMYTVQKKQLIKRITCYSKGENLCRQAGIANKKFIQLYIYINDFFKNIKMFLIEYFGWIHLTHTQVYA